MHAQTHTQVVGQYSGNSYSTHRFLFKLRRPGRSVHGTLPSQQSHPACTFDWGATILKLRVKRAPEGDGRAGLEGSRFIKDENEKLKLGISGDKWSGYLSPRAWTDGGLGSS